jgi:outer membrane protein W
LFNLSGGAKFNYSSISRQAKNADGHFSAMEIYLTPSLTLPAKPDPRFKVLIGAGLGLYSFGTLRIDASQAGGENMTIKYKSTIGYHGQILFHLKFQRDAYIILGAKYYDISYTFREKGSTHYSNDRRINNPEGSGFGLVVGIGGPL